jgi:D-alanine-D-alanine ligase
MSSRIKVGILCGGKSSEHEISCISAKGLLNAMDRDRFEPILIGITQSGKWVMPPPDAQLTIRNHTLPVILESYPALNADIHGFSFEGKSLEIDVIFPVLHGPYGEDGTVQGMLEMSGIKYVGSGVLASAVAMDKSFAKPIFQASGLKVAPGMVIHQREWSSATKAALLARASEFQLPLFVKPARGGSSRGTSKVKTSDQLESAIEFAFTFDTKVMIEVGISGKEIECAILQTQGVAEASPLGEIVILGEHEFYDFEAKYLDDSTRVDSPEELSSQVQEVIRKAAITAFDALGCEGLARVDFFYANDGQIYINELNTMPGFTQTSVYPKLWSRTGLSYTELISKLIDAALWRSSDVTR